jgi:mannosyl-oligosaccharide alpha-1,2-mannosidase
VKIAFKKCWTSYKQRAWLQDELKPLSGDFSNRYGGWGATLFDSLDTLLIMGMSDEYSEAIEAALSVDIGPDTLQAAELSVFETTIRFLGGLLAAYDLTECKDKRILDKAVEFGDMLYLALDTPNRIPVNNWDLRKAVNWEEQVDTEHIMAQLGSLSLEFTHLSQLTGDMRWFDAVQRLMDMFDAQQRYTKMPGLWPLNYHVENGTVDFTKDNVFSLGAMADSTYEYFLKMVLLLGGSYQGRQYARIYKYAAETAIEELLFRPMVPGDLDILLPGKAYVTDDGNVTLQAESEHLEAFVGGMFALGGRLFGIPEQVDVARRVTAGFVWAYNATQTGIAPENFIVMACEDKDECMWDEMEWRERVGEHSRMPRGFVGTRDTKYLLRPEAVEAVFYMYRLTGDSYWRDVAWWMFETLEARTRTEWGNAELVNVFEESSIKGDKMESFWMGETLKYLYLIFAEENMASLDDFVFSTEAHPFKR